MAGVLYIVATPIGNLEDISFRAVRVLKEADLVCCEDTRHSAKLFNHYGFHPVTLSVHEHNEEERLPRVLRELEQGKRVALISDGGTPTVSDPGFKLVRACREAGHTVVPIPGATAAMAALSAAGLPTDRVTFHGFPPEKPGKRQALFAEVAHLKGTQVFYLAPHKTVRQLDDLAGAFGERAAVLCRELTKIHEEYVTGTLTELADRYRDAPPKGEIVLVVAGAAEEGMAEDPQVVLLELRAEGLTGRSLSEALMARCGLRKKEAYRLALDKPEVSEEPD